MKRRMGVREKTEGGRLKRGKISKLRRRRKWQELLVVLGVIEE